MIPENFRINGDILIIPFEKGFKVIIIEEIIAFTGCKSGTSVICKNEDDSTVCKVTLKAFEAAFAPRGFYRIHKNSLVNTFHIKRFDRSEGELVTMCKGQPYTVARAKCTAFVEAMLKPYRDLMANTSACSPKPTGYGTGFTVRGFWPNKLGIALYIWQVLYDTTPVELCLL